MNKYIYIWPLYIYIFEGLNLIRTIKDNWNELLNALL